MSIKSKNEQNEESRFEELLALYLMKEANLEERKELYKLIQEKPMRFERLAELSHIHEGLELLYRKKQITVSTTLDAKLVTQSSNRWTRILKAVAVLLLFFLPVVYYYFEYNFPLQETPLQAAFTNTYGVCSNLTEALRGKKNTFHRRKVSSGTFSACDLFLKKENKISLRLLSDTEILIYDRPRGVSIQLIKGHLLADISRLDSSEFVNFIHSETIVRVRGTRLELLLDYDNSIHVRLFDGKIAVSQNSLLALFSESFHQSQEIELSQWLAQIESKSDLQLNPISPIILKNGQSVILPPMKTAKRNLIKNLRLKIKKSIKEPSRAELIFKQIQAAIKELGPRQQKILLHGTKVQINTIPANTAKESQVLFEKLSLSPERKADKKNLKMIVEQSNGLQSYQVITLNNGNKLEGFVYQEGDSYVLITSEGKTVIPSKTVKNIEDVHQE